MKINKIEINEEIIIELISENGLVLCDGLDFCDRRMLSKFDKQETWTEMTEENAIEITDKNKKIIEEQTNI